MRKSKDWLTRNQVNVSEWNDMSTHGLFFFSHCVLSRQATHTNCTSTIVFGSTRPELEPKIYRNRGEHGTIIPTIGLRLVYSADEVNVNNSLHSN
jgi:hypothetical protein